MYEFLPVFQIAASDGMHLITSPVLAKLNLRDVCGKINYIFQHNRGTILMAVRYNKLWKLLVDKKMSKADLRRQAADPAREGMLCFQNSSNRTGH